MKPAAILLLAGFAAAFPFQKRGVSTVVVVETVTQTSTKWVDASGAAYTPHPTSTSASSSSATTTSSSSSSTSASSTSSISAVEALVSSTTSVSSTSTDVVPTTATSTYVPPSTTSTSVYVAPSTSTAAPAATSEASSGGYTGTAQYSGDITYYTPGLGSCGETNTSSDAIVAISVELMNQRSTGNPNTNGWCNVPIIIMYNGVETPATIVDTCQACAYGSIDLTPGLFQKVAPNGDGRVHDVSWRLA